MLNVKLSMKVNHDPRTAVPQWSPFPLAFFLLGALILMYSSYLCLKLIRKEDK